MANIMERKNQDGTVSYLIRVSNGYNIDGKHLFKCRTYRTTLGMSSKQIKKELRRQIVLFEEEVKGGAISNSNIKFEAYSKYWMEMNRLEWSPVTYINYKFLLQKINSAIGHMKISKIQPRQLKEFYRDLGGDKGIYAKKPLAPGSIKA